MNVRSIVFGSIVVFVAANLVTAQEEAPPSQFEHVKELGQLVGFWVNVSQPDDEPAGEFTISARWAANRSYLQMQFNLRGEGAPTHMGTIQFGWNGANKQLNSWGFWPDQQAHGRVTVDENKIHVKEEGIDADGKKTSADVTMEIDGDKMTVHITNSRRGDQITPDQTYSFERRQRPQRFRQRAAE